MAERSSHRTGSCNYTAKRERCPRIYFLPAGTPIARVWPGSGDAPHRVLHRRRGASAGLFAVSERQRGFAEAELHLDALALPLPGGICAQGRKGGLGSGAVAVRRDEREATAAAAREGSCHDANQLGPTTLCALVDTLTTRHHH